ncbi:MAG: cytochrome c biogenesis protein ResB [Chloroflexi bacterium]|nr:cytochrome c biogenesis protein ResB [Chloroflexota bacterium]
MSTSLRGDALSAAQDPLDEPEGRALSLPVGDVFERLWHLLISMRTGLALMLFLGFLTFIGTLLTQVPAGTQAVPSAYADFLDAMRAKYGGWTTVFDALGLFAVFSSIWFKATLVLLTTSILACSINRAPRLWRQAVHPRIAASPAFLDHAPLAGYVAVPIAVDHAAEVVRAELKRHHFRTLVTTDEDGVAIFADRFRWGPFGTVIAHLSLILILGGAVLGMGGFRNTDFAVAIGSTVPVGNGTALSLKATDFRDLYYENGSPADYVSHLVLYDNGVQVAERDIRVNDPLRYGDVTFYQSFFGPAADMVVKDSTGKTVFDQGVPLIWGSNDGKKSIGQLTIPGSDLVVYVIGVASGKSDATIKAGQLQVEVYSSANQTTPIGLQVVDEGKPATIAGLDFTFVRERQFTGLIVARDPGALFVWAGALALVLGVILVFLFPSRRIWARVRGSGTGSDVYVAAATRHDMGFESTFRALIDGVQEKGR